MSAVIKENHMKYGGKRYFKAGGNMITIRTFGSKGHPQVKQTIWKLTMRFLHQN